MSETNDTMAPGEREASYDDAVTHLRTSMDLRRQAEAELAQAAEARRAAVDHADAVLAQAQQAAESLRRETERAGMVTSAEAQRRAEETVAAARAEAARLQEEAESRVLAMHHQATSDIAEARLAFSQEQSATVASRAALLDGLEVLGKALQRHMAEVSSGVDELFESIATLRAAADIPAGEPARVEAEVAEPAADADQPRYRNR